MSNTFQFDHNRLFDNLENALNSDLASLAVEANGGRSILFVYPADEDEEYIEETMKRLPDDLKDIVTAFEGYRKNRVE